MNVIEAWQYAIEERDQQLLNYTFLLEHYMAELETAGQSGLMHDHSEAPAKRVQPAPPGRIRKKVNYRRYLMGHRRGGELKDRRNPHVRYVLRPPNCPYAQSRGSSDAVGRSGRRRLWRW